MFRSEDLARRSAVLRRQCAVLGTAQAAGFLWRGGHPEVGLASAGFAARAASPSTLLTNPAGMSRLEGSQVELGSVLVYGHLQFAPDSQTDPILGRNDGGNAVGFLPSGGVFATFGPWRDVRFGLGVLTNFGAPESWDPPWLGCYYTTKTAPSASVMPGVAHITDGLSVGGTVNAMYASSSRWWRCRIWKRRPPTGVSRCPRALGGSAATSASSTHCPQRPASA